MKSRTLCVALIAVCGFPAWYELYPHSVSVRHLAAHPMRYSNRMVRLSGMLCSSGDSEYLGFTQPVLNDYELPIGVRFATRYVASTSSRVTLMHLHRAGQLLSERPQQGARAQRYMQVPATIVGWLTYHEACFSSGLTVQVLFLSAPIDNVAAHVTRHSEPVVQHSRGECPPPPNPALQRTRFARR